MISTITMVKAGKTHGNWMVDVVASNTKLKNRAVGMLCAITGIDPELSRKTLEEHDWKVKSAVIGVELGLDHVAAVELLRANDDILAKALGEKA
jgi:N-acetylmuramic acid 6-phosphate etherase